MRLAWLIASPLVADTAGFGINSHPYDPKCLNPYNLWSYVSDASKSWAAQLANLLDMEPVVTAVSGVGLDSAYGNKPWDYYRDNANPFDPDEKFDYSDSPSAVIILLGPNDCGKSNGNNCPNYFNDLYVEMLQHYLAVYDSKVPVVSVIGGSSSGYNQALVDAVREATR